MIDEWRSFPNKAEKLKSKFEIINLFGKIKSAIIEEQDHWVVVFFLGYALQNILSSS